MSEPIIPSTPNATPEPAPDPQKARARRGFIDKALLDAIKAGADCAREAAKPEIVPALTEREWLPAEQAQLVASSTRCAAFVQRIKDLRTGKLTRTEEEDAARTELLRALDPILKGARRLPAEATAQREAFGLGGSILKKSTADLLILARYAKGQLSPGEGGVAPRVKLKGVLPREIAAVATLADRYEGADWAQGDAETQAAAVLAQLRQEIEEVLTPLAHDLQRAADQAFTHLEPVNAAQRAAFGLQPDRPFTA